MSECLRGNRVPVFDRDDRADRLAHVRQRLRDPLGEREISREFQGQLVRVEAEMSGDDPIASVDPLDERRNLAAEMEVDERGRDEPQITGEHVRVRPVAAHDGGALREPFVDDDEVVFRKSVRQCSELERGRHPAGRVQRTERVDATIEPIATEGRSRDEREQLRPFPATRIDGPSTLRRGRCGGSPARSHAPRRRQQALSGDDASARDASPVERARERRLPRPGGTEEFRDLSHARSLARVGERRTRPHGHRAREGR